MHPSPDGIHGFVGVQVAFGAYVALALAITACLWWLGLPANATVLAFLAVCAALLVPFWPVFRRHYPEHRD